MTDISNSAVVLLAGDTRSSWTVAAALRRRFGNIPIIVERPISTLAGLRSRARRMGFARTVGQILFKFVLPMACLAARRRLNELYDILPPPLSSDSRDVHCVTSVNDDETVRLLRDYQPRVVVVNGTRIIGKKTLAAAEVFINTHAGITPLYRGVHGGYWALTEDDSGNFGATIHLVDVGVDTGRALARVRSVPTRRDNFVTYPLLQLAEALPTLLNVVDEILAGRMPGGDEELHTTSKQWFHPTILQYLCNGFSKGVW